MPELMILAAGDSPQAQAHARGKLFEELIRILFRSYGYEILDLALNYAGMEIDVVGKNQLSDEPIYAECKCYDKPVDSPQLQAFAGKFFARWKKNNRALGIFIALPSLNGYAKTFYKENFENDQNTKFRLLEKTEILSKIYEVMVCVGPEHVGQQIPENLGTPGDQVLLYTDNNGLFWAQYVIPVGGAIPTQIAFFDRQGRVVSDKDSIEYLIGLNTEFSAFELLNISRSGSPQLASLPSNTEQIVEVRGGSAWFEYQFPASPQFYVGRDDVFAQIDAFTEQVSERKTSARGLLIIANSGWGKSSTVLTAVDRLGKKGHYAIAVDSRSVSSSQFILRVIEHIFRKFTNFEGLLDARSTLTISGFEGAVDLLVELGTQLQKHGKLLFIFLDQFENVFFQNDALKHVRDLFLRLCDVQTNIVMCFSWKTDIIGQVDSFPYHVREDITRSSVVIPLNIFSLVETDMLLDYLETELHSRLRNDLRFFLSEFSQGYPWLLKKLCAHVKSQCEQGVPQTQLAYSLLNVEELFQSDMKGLLSEEEEALKQIAKRVPISATEIGEEFSTEVVRALVDRRLLVRVGAKYDIYWDIFRDYLNTGRVPVQENYMLRVQAARVLKTIRRLHQAISEGKVLELTDVYSLNPDVSSGTLVNIIHEMKLLGLIVTDENQGTIKLPHELFVNTLSFEQSLQGHLYERLQRNILVARLVEILNQEGEIAIARAAYLLQTWCPYISASPKTWQTYARIFAGWMKAAGLASPVNQTGLIIRAEPDMVHREYGLIDVEKGKRNRNLMGLPNVQIGPIETALVRLMEAVENGTRIDLTGFTKTTWLKALASLENLGFIIKQPRSITVLPIASEYFSAALDQRKEILANQALSIDPFEKFIKILDENKVLGLSLSDLGLVLEERLRVDWADSTAKGNAKIMLNWARHLSLAPGKFAGRRKRNTGYQQSLFDNQ